MAGFTGLFTEGWIGVPAASAPDTRSRSDFEAETIVRFGVGASGFEESAAEAPSDDASTTVFSTGESEEDREPSREIGVQQKSTSAVRIT